jgi:uncharacterized protein YbjT (DUF2867 family)
MKILLTGATGFIGSHLRRALLDAGHTLLCTGRHLGADSAGCRWAVADFSHTTTTRWSELLIGIDAVVNSAGVFRERSDASFADVHGTGPRRLFAACVSAGVPRVVHVSALGADEQAASEFHLSKRAADDYLLSLPLDATVVQPSLVFGLDGTSSRALLVWASLPIVALPAGGAQGVQPVHVADVVAAVLALLRTPERWRGQRIALVGPVPLTLRDYLRTLRAGLGLPAARTLDVPATAVRALLSVAERLPGALFDRAAWQMLERGNIGDASRLAELLGRVPRAAARFIEPDAADAARSQAQLGWLLPLLRAALAVMWIVTAAVSFGLYPVSDSYALLQRAGVPAAWQPLALHGAAALDLLLGVLTLWPQRAPRAQRALWAAQIALILGYTAIITWRLPEYWLHPYGPISKNLPLLALLVALYTLAPRTARG